MLTVTSSVPCNRFRVEGIYNNSASFAQASLAVNECTFGMSIEIVSCVMLTCRHDAAFQKFLSPVELLICYFQKFWRCSSILRVDCYADAYGERRSFFFVL